jgi:hypothetical protein
LFKDIKFTGLNENVTKEDLMQFQAQMNRVLNHSFNYIKNNQIISIEADKINANELSAISANLGTITAGNITGVTIDIGTPVGGVTPFSVDSDGKVICSAINITGTQTSGSDSLSIGPGADASGDNSIVYGKDCLGDSDNSVAVGNVARVNANSQRSVALGYAAIVSTSSQDCIAIGNVSQAQGDYSISIGSQAQASNQGLTPTQYKISIGNGSIADGTGSIAIGRSSLSTNTNSLAIGTACIASGSGSIAIGNNSSATGTNTIVFGNGVSSSTSNQVVFGSFSSTKGVQIFGALNVTGSKSFAIPHPTKEGYMLRHGCYEGNVPGGNIYRYTTTAINGTSTVELPEYYKHINKDSQVWLQGRNHFGRAYGNITDNTLTITADTDGEYDVLIMATRDDKGVQEWYIMGEEKPNNMNWDGTQNNEGE